MFTVPLFQGSFLEIGWNRPCLRLDKAPEKDVVVFFSRRYGFAPYCRKLSEIKWKKTLGAQGMFIDKDRLIDPFVFWDGVSGVPIMIFSCHIWRGTIEHVKIASGLSDSCLFCLKLMGNES